MTAALRILRHLAVVALFARAILPAGWMPDAQAGLTICSATLGAIHHDSTPGHHDAAHEDCPFAAAGTMVAAPDAPQFVLPAAHAFIARIDRAHAAIIAARFSPASPRAPPRLA